MHTKYRPLNRIFNTPASKKVMILTVLIAFISGGSAFIILNHHVNQYKYFKHLENVSIPTKCLVKNYQFAKQRWNLYFFPCSGKCRGDCSCYNEQSEVLYRIKNSSQIISTIYSKTYKPYKKEVRQSILRLTQFNTVDFH